MKVHILGPQDYFSTEESIAKIKAGEMKSFGEPKWLGIDLDMEDVPREGQSIVLDGGTVYVVTDVTWFIGTEAGDRNALAEKNGPKVSPNSVSHVTGTPGRVDTVHVAVKPKDSVHEKYGNDFQIAETVRRLGDLLYGERAKDRQEVTS